MNKMGLEDDLIAELGVQSQSRALQKKIAQKWGNEVNVFTAFANAKPKTAEDAVQMYCQVEGLNHAGPNQGAVNYSFAQNVLRRDKRTAEAITSALADGDYTRAAASIKQLVTYVLHADDDVAKHVSNVQHAIRTPGFDLAGFANMLKTHVKSQTGKDINSLLAIGDYEGFTAWYNRVEASKDADVKPLFLT
jgi:hypothetical protein